MPQNPLDLRERDAGLEQVRCAAVAKLMDRHASYARGLSQSTNHQADSCGFDAFAEGVDQQRLLIESTGQFEPILPVRKVRFDAPPHALADGHVPLSTRLASVDFEDPLLAVPVVHRESLELATPQSCTVQDRQNAYRLVARMLLPP